MMAEKGSNICYIYRISGREREDSRIKGVRISSVLQRQTKSSR